MTRAQWIYVIATLLSAQGMWLLLPRRSLRGRMLGLLFALAGLGLFGSRVPLVGSAAAHALFLALAGVTIVSAAATVTLRSPVYSAIWFALSLMGTAGLFLYQGAQFLAVATIVVYAGAILVTFLFVLMLANPEGHAYYDRLSWEALLSASAGAVLVGILTMTLASSFASPNRAAPRAAAQPASEHSGDVLAGEHMAHLGKHLFSEHLIAVEIAGTLLLIALVGAVAIAAAAGPVRASTQKTTGPPS